MRIYGEGFSRFKVWAGLVMIALGAHVQGWNDLLCVLVGAALIALNIEVRKQ